MDKIRRRYRRATGRLIMHNTDWCFSWQSNHPGQSCSQSRCPHEQHCDGLVEFYKNLPEEE